MRIQLDQCDSKKGVQNTLNLEGYSATTVTLSDDKGNELLRLSFAEEGKKIQILSSKRIKLTPGYECRFLQGELISEKED